MNDSYEVRPINKKLWREFYGTNPQHTLQGFVIFYKGKARCVVAIFHHFDKFLIISDIRDTKNIPKATIWKAAKEVYAKIANLGYSSLYAVADPDLESAPRFLNRLGFFLYSITEEGHVYKWVQQPYH